MANRNIDTELWNDTKIADTFTPEDKYFWLFLLTTRYGNLSGIFEISTKQIARDMGYSVETVDNLIYRFETYHALISYNRDTKEIFIYNWYKYNWTRSPKFEKSLFKYINQIKHESFKEVVVIMYEEFKEGDTVSIPYRYHTNTNAIPNTISNTKSLSNTLKDSDIKEVDNGRTKKDNVQNMSNNNTKTVTTKSKTFVKPTLEEVTAYCNERNNGVDPNKFINFYESKGWMVGKNKMKDWKASVRTWEEPKVKKQKLENIGSVTEL